MGRRKDGMPRSNRELYDAMMDLRKGSRTTPYDANRTKRQNTRQTQIDAELKDEDYDDEGD